MSTKKRDTLIAMAEVYGEQMTKIRLSAYLNILCDLSDEDLYRAFMVLVDNPLQRKMPLPAEIKRAAFPKLNPKEEAIRRVDLMKQGVRKFGHMNPADAEDFLGVEIWNSVERMGGWKRLCESPECNLGDPIVYAQARDVIHSQVQAERTGFDYAQIPGKHANPQLEQKSFLKKLGGFVKGVDDVENQGEI